MNLSTYQLLAERTSKFANEGYSDNRLLMATLGLAGEAGEVADYIKKVIFHGHNLDNQKLLNELGDVLWYLAELCTLLGFKLEDLSQDNIAKLAARYGAEFSSEKSINRSE